MPGVPATSLLITDILGVIEFACRFSGPKLISVWATGLRCSESRPWTRDVKAGAISPTLRSQLKPAVAGQLPEIKETATSEDKCFVAGGEPDKNVLVEQDKILA